LLHSLSFAIRGDLFEFHSGACLATPLHFLFFSALMLVVRSRIEAQRSVNGESFVQCDFLCLEL
ncbi:hypothetical protein T01_4945, partial [Trichinella spiralis]